jgi:hypothetical protein
LVEEEEHKKKVMGMSALGKCLSLVRIAALVSNELGEQQNMPGAVLKVFTDRAIKMEGWNVDTMSRYISLGKKIESMPDLKNLLVTQEYTHGRGGSFDQITALRSLSQIGTCPTASFVELVCVCLCVRY